jgi:predicted PP-loop superfamily ATPase
MDKNKKIDINTYRQAADMLAIGNRAVRKAQEENRRFNVPNVYSHNGTLFYELPNGELTTEDPFQDSVNR